MNTLLHVHYEIHDEVRKNDKVQYSFLNIYIIITLRQLVNVNSLKPVI